MACLGPCPLFIRNIYNVDRNPDPDPDLDPNRTRTLWNGPSISIRKYISIAVVKHYKSEVYTQHLLEVNTRLYLPKVNTRSYEIFKE